MELTITRRDLVSAATRAASVADRASTMPILSNALLRADVDRLTLSATDLYIGIASSAACKAQRPGAVAVAAKTLADIAKALPDGDVTLALDGHSLVIRAGRSRFRIATMPGDDFPPLQRAGEDALRWRIAAPVLGGLLARVSHAASNDDSRPHLSGVLLDLGCVAGIATAVATDGHRLAHAATEAEGVPTVRLLVPTRGVVEARRMLDAAGADDVECTTDGRTLWLRHGETELSVKLADEAFPPYQKVIPQTHERRAVVARDALVASVKRAKLVADGIGAARLTLDEGTLTVRAEHVDRGDVSEAIDCDVSGSTVTVGVNAGYLLDALSGVDGDEVALEMCGELDPVVMRPVGGDGFVAVVMPMRV